MKKIFATADFSVGRTLKCKYPKHGTRNILVNREGTIEKSGTGPAGPYVVLALKDGSYRTLSQRRMVDAQNA